MKNNKKTNINKKILKRIFSYSKKYKLYLTGAFLFALISVGFTLLAPVLTGNAIDNIIEKGNVDFDAVLNIIIILSVTIGLAALFTWLMNVCTNAVSTYTVRDMRRDVFDKLNSVPLSYVDTHSHGDLISRIINDVDAVGDGLMHVVTQFFSGVATILGTIIFMLTINVKIALVVVCVTPLSLFTAAFIGKIAGKNFRAQQELQGDISGFVEEMVSNQTVIKTFMYEPKSFEQFDKMNKRLYTVGQKAQFTSSLSNPSTRLVNAIVYACVGIIGAFFAVSGTLTVGRLSSFLIYANQYTKPFNEVAGVLTQIQTAFESSKRVFKVLDEESEKAETNKIKKLPLALGNVEFKNVNFSYTPKQRLIQNFSLSVKKGQRIAIVGPTGCGKTTLINLLMRFYEVNSGQILIDGIDTKDISRNTLRSNFGMVLQDSFLFNQTVMENLRYGNENATDEQIIAAAKSAFAHSFIRKMSNGYNTLIAPDGGNLSQGQKQLLCIARAMVTDPPILILDEATSSIDTLTELKVQKAFAKMMKNKTSFVVAHRLSTIKEADVILVMKDGNVIEQGNHDELISRGGFYAKLYQSQFEQK